MGFFFFFIFLTSVFLFVEIITKFNKDMYAKMRSKKGEPLSNIGKRTVRIIRKGLTSTISVTPIVSGTETTRMASPDTSVEKIPTPASKRPRLSDKKKEKADSRPFTVEDNERLAVEKAHKVVTAEDLKVFSGAPINEVATRHVHKLVQVKCSCNFYFFFFFFFLGTDDFNFLFRCWGRVSILLLSTSLRRLRWHL